ncbi:MAG: 16S rRNA (cytosine(1402)-N(4))-methyltransferase RsmH [Bacteroidia bacterium]
MMMSKETYHIPVLLNNCIEGLNIIPNGTYVDLTFGGGGHSKEILKHLNQEGRLIAFDQDKDALKNIPDDKRLLFIPQNFRFIKNYLRLNGITKVDGILGDLGVSSHQFDSGERGFSLRFDGPLDMRMNQDAKLSAEEIINGYDEPQLTKLFKEYGELNQAKKIAQTICRNRNEKKIETTKDLVKCVQGLYPKREEHKFLAKLFQAIRLEVNDEIGALKKCLTDCVDILKVGGRLVIVSYHSLEDRLVKNLMKTGNVEGVVNKDPIYGNSNVPFRLVVGKPILPDETELEINTRSRSAKLRIAEKI